MRGDVVVLPFPFSNLAASKRRPALVVANAGPHDDVILCMITSRRTRDGYAIPLTSCVGSIIHHLRRTRIGRNGG
ncbi:MAG: type II toxin-antitoxin system PemK/MazF family toxin [Caldilinea sp.]